MSVPVELHRRVEMLEAEQVRAATGAIVIYQAADTDEERAALVPPGAEHVIFIPDNGRDARPI